MKTLRPALLLLFTTALPAQGLLIGPDPAGPPGGPERPRPVRHHGLHIASTKVHADIVDGVATTTIDQIIRNDTRAVREAVWFMPLQRGAVADSFTMTVGGKEMAGEVLDAGRARSVYESIVRRRRDPGLLEYAGEGMLRARIFPIPANGEVGVTVRLRQVLQPTGGMFEWQWPVKAAQLGDAGGGQIGLEVRIKSKAALSTVVTPHASAEIRRDGQHHATVSLEGATSDLDDLRVLYGLTEQEFGLHLMTYRQQGEPGYFTMLLSPPRTLADAKVPPRLVQLVVDTSGSMKGDKIRQAKASLHTFLQSLRDEDHFQIVTFASSVQPFFAKPQRATRANVDAALARVDSLAAMGGTNIAAALQEVLASSVPTDDGQQLLPQVIFVTDGQPTVGLTKPNEILELTMQADKSRTRIFALGVGDRIDVRLIDDLVEQHHGARDFVGNHEKIEAKVDALCQKLSRPALTDVTVACDGLDAFHQHPGRTRDLFCGEMMQIVGRYRGHGARTVRVSGLQNGVRKQFSFDVTFPEADAKYDFVQTLWARQHVAQLLDSIRRNGANRELIQEVRQLATRYGIVTPYTSQLIVEEGMRLGAQPVSGVGGGGRWRGRVPAPNGGVRGPGASGPGGPSTGGPSTAGPAGPAGPAPAAQADAANRGLARLGRVRSGREAIEESKAVQTGSDDFYLGARRKADREDRRGGKQKPMVRRAAGRCFVAVGDDLVEQGLPENWRKQAVVIESFHADYFRLLEQKPALRAILALGDRVVFRDGERIVHVRPAAAKESEVKKPAGKEPAAEKPAGSEPGRPEVESPSAGEPSGSTRSGGGN